MNQAQGIVYLVGAGPGDPFLITLRGRHCLERAQVLLYDALANPDFLSWLPEDCERIHVGKRYAHKSATQEEINALLIEHCRAGRIVVRLKGGDPYVFGRGAEEAAALHAAGCRFEVVPGITAASALGAYAGIPLTHRDCASSVALLTGHGAVEGADAPIRWEQVLPGADTLVVYMGLRNLEDISRKMIEQGRPPDTPAALVSFATLPCQRILEAPLADIAPAARRADIQAPALLVVGEVVRLRRSLDWFHRRPLAARRIVVTRSAAQARDFMAALREAGAEPIEFPVIDILPPADPGPLTDAIRALDRFDWLVLTSNNGAEAFFDALHEAGLDSRALAGLRIAVIGPATRARFEARGLRPELMPDPYTAEALARSMADQGPGRVLLPQADIARPALREALAAQDFEVETPVAYRTCRAQKTDDELAALRQQLHRIDAVTFTSASTVRHFFDMLGPEAFRSGTPPLFACIGPVTAEALRRRCPPDAPLLEAPRHDVPGLLEALIAHYSPAKEPPTP